MDDLGALFDFETVLPAAGPDSWQDALLAARILRAGGRSVGGLWLKARAGGVRDAYLEYLRTALAPHENWVRVPAAVPLSALTGTIDIAATAVAGRLVSQAGLLARAHHGVLLVPMAERLEPSAAALIGDAMDTRKSAKVGRSDREDECDPAEFTVIAIDESAGPEERLPAALEDRLGLVVDLNTVSWSQIAAAEPKECAASRPSHREVAVADGMVRLLSAVAGASGATSLRTLQHLVSVCRAHAALSGRTHAVEEDALTALRLCLGLTLGPQQQPGPDPAEAPSQDSSPQGPSDMEKDGKPPQRSPDDPEDGERALTALATLLAALEAGSIDGLLDFAQSRATASIRARSGKSGAARKNARRGRPVSVASSAPYPDARPNIIATLRAAAPWQLIRMRKRKDLERKLGVTLPAAAKRQRPLITRDDYRYQRLRHETPSTAIFVVDASGSTALERLGETKGAIEQLLARCYVRRDEVAMIAFRGTAAETVLPPTRSLVMAKRKLADLPGGGPTPLVAGLVRGLEMALGLRRQGSTPILVLLTDGRGNIALDGTPNRALAAEQLVGMASRCRSEAIRSICIDIARRPREAVAGLAQAMGADLHFLRHADARRLSDVVNTSLEEAHP